MQVSSHTRPTAPAPDHAQALAEALQLIAHGTGDEKVRFIAERDPDWFIDHVLDFSSDALGRDEVAPPRPVIDRRMLDEAIARLALRDRTFPALAATA